jgi:4-aminobutyrate aminotransferase-like enzyme
MTMINAFPQDGADRLSPQERALVERRARVLGPAYRLFYQRPVHVVRGEGVWLYGPDGERYLDAYNNVACVGHCHPHVVDALARQAAVLNTHTRYLGETVVDYAERLTATLPGEISQVMFTCTGSEANDLALRIARAHTGATGVIVTANAYHGVTAAVAELSPSLGPANRLGAHVRTVPAPTGRGEAFAEGVRAALADLQAHGIRPAALLVDTIFSSDGVFADPPGFLIPAAEAVRAAGGLFIADEVQAGFGRTGSHFWGFSRHDLTPDLVTMGKPMGNGHPMAAMAGRPEVLTAFGADCRYFNTFGGNPVSCAAGMAVLDVIEDEKLMANAADVGRYLRDGLVDLGERTGTLGQVRGAGLFLGVDVAGGGESAARVVNGLRERRVLISASGPDGSVLKIRPPLVFSRGDADLLLGALREVVAGL